VEYLDAYLASIGMETDVKAPLFRSAAYKSG
jgi:hypothetical protein